MSALRDIQNWMTFFGWEDGGGPGSVKRISGLCVAQHGDAKWQSDLEYACYRAEMAKRDVDQMDRLDAALSPPQSPDEQRGGGE